MSGIEGGTGGGGGGGGTALADASTFTRGTTQETPVAGVVETTPTLTTGKASALSLDTSGNLRTTVANGVAAGTAGAPGTQVLSVQGIAAMTPLQVSVGPPAGASFTNAIAPATPASVTLKGAAGNLLSLTAVNTSATTVYIKFFDTAAAVTLGTTSATFQIPVPGNTGGAGVTVNRTLPRAFANAIKYAVTGGVSLTDNTAITANTVVVDIDFN